MTDQNHTPRTVDVRCGDCGKHLPGWQYKPMFVQCLDCAEVADTMTADTARLVAGVHQQLRDAFAQSGRTVPEVEKLTGISQERVSALIDGRVTATVSELLRLGLAFGHNAADWFRAEAVNE
ncbi:helix-turn-helix transcriptional regulator [Nocardia flavorosea]|uniref:helix-turn-helix domain-containing protein n=1 Tax=Nocardia flavorosea TaxID=53429 RepID=UPI0018954E6E|nr:helix-turn-helix transcriptional regulator [Nocardia flavorosea]MBF6350334.1 helix-turn-helix transcriptional regulator [Nocardia flavorosea]